MSSHSQDPTRGSAMSSQTSDGSSDVPLSSFISGAAQLRPQIPPARISALYDEEEALEKRSRNIKLEIIDDDKPAPPNYIADDGAAEKFSTETIRGGLQLGRQDEAPPMMPHQFEELDDGKKSPTGASATVSRIAPPSSRSVISRLFTRNHSFTASHSRANPPSSMARESSQSNTNSPPVFHEVEATAIQGVEAKLIIDQPRPPIVNAVAVENVDDSADSWWKRYQKCLFLGLTLIIGALIGTIVIILNAGSKGGVPPIEALPIPIPPSRPTTSLPIPVTPIPTLKPMTATPTLKPASISQLLQASAMELVPNEEIINHVSKKNVAIYGDTAIIGAPSNDNERGSAFVFVRDENGEWALQDKLVAPDGAAGDRFGYSVGIYGDTVIVGAFDDNGYHSASTHESGSGSAHIFARNRVTWTHQAKLVAPDGAAGDIFGWSVGIYGNTVIVGAREDDDNGSGSGSAHIFTRNGVAWTHQAKLLAPDGAAYDYFGYSVGIYGDTAIIGAYHDDDNGSAIGSAHIFARNGVAWPHQDKLLAPDGADCDSFGVSVGIYGDTVIVGAYRDDDKGYHSGSAHIFIRNGVAWSHQAKLLAPDGAACDKFGFSVGVYGDTVIIGARYDDDNGNNSGSAHLFVRNGVTWSHQAKLAAPKSGQSRFGQSVDIYNGTTISGSCNGEVYVFSG